MRSIDEDLDEQVARLIRRICIVFTLIFIGFACLVGCASAPKARPAECHVLTVNPVTEKHIDGATTEHWLAWCGEGRYVVFQSSVTAGERVTFTEYQEDDQLQIHGAISGRK